MKNKRKWISKAATSLGLLTMIGGIALSAGSSVYAAPPAQNISGNTLSDTTSKRSITIWKYEIHSASELGERGDGESLDPAVAPDLVGKELMADVNFEIIRVLPKDGVSLKDPLVNKEDTGSGGDYTIDPTFTRQTGKTGDGTGGTTFGALTFDVGTGKAGDGIYLVREIPDSSGKYTYKNAAGETNEINKPMDPFFVWLPQTKRDNSKELIYDVHVHPKNIVTDTELDKTIEGGKGYSIKAGQDFQWEATTKLPDGLYFQADKDMIITDRVDPDNHENTLPDLNVSAGDKVYADYFRVTDDLNTKLLLDDVEVWVLKGSTWTQLDHDDDYEVTLNGTAVNAPNAVEDLTTGAKKVVVSLTNDGMEKVTTNENTHIQVRYKTHVDKDFNGTIGNEYEVDYLIPGQKPVHDEEGEPEYYTGGFDIEKHAEDGTTMLQGAEFYLAETEADAKNRMFLASDGKSYKLNEDGTSVPATLPDGATFLTSTSDATGKAEFNGLKLDWFTDNPAGANPSDGKQDPNDTSEATWDKEKQNETDPYISKEYWLVETKSPSGYELLKDPVPVLVTLSSHEDLIIEVENKHETKLPFTGGTGTMLLVIIAIGAITIGTAAIAIDKKRRAV